MSQQSEVCNTDSSVGSGSRGANALVHAEMHDLKDIDMNMHTQTSGVHAIDLTAQNAYTLEADDSLQS